MTTASKKTVSRQTTGKKTAPPKTADNKVVSKKTVAKKPAAKKSAAEKKTTKPRVRKFDLVIDKVKGAKWIKEDIRPQFEYRHFGVEEATGRQYGSHVIRVAKGAKPPVRHHVHPDCEFLLVYVLKGWVNFWYEGEGEVRLNVGDVHLLPAGIKHAVTGWSKDLEMLETTNPADYRWVGSDGCADCPSGVKGRRFLRFLCAVTFQKMIAPVRRNSLYSPTESRLP